MLNIVFVGDTRTGKTSLIEYFKSHSFPEDYFPTGVAATEATLFLNKKNAKLNIIEIGGNESFDLSKHSHLRTAHAIVITYDVVNESSFVNVEKWYRQVQEIAPSNVKYVISANKISSKPQNSTLISGALLAERLETDFITTSADQGVNVSELFYKVYLAWNAEQEAIRRNFQINVLKQDTTSYSDYNKFLMFGDSITEYAFNQFPISNDKIEFCFGPALQNAYVRKLQVIQRGFSGYTSRDALPLIKAILRTEHDDVSESKKIKIGYVFFGSNDARLKGVSSSNTEHVPLDNFLLNMKQVVAEFKKRSIPVIVITPGLHDAAMWDKVDPQDLVTGDFRDNTNQKLYQDAMKEAFPDTPLICLYDLMEDWMKTKAENPSDLSELLYDGIHLNGNGYKLLFDELMKTIEKHYYQVSPSYLTYKFPYSTTLKPDTFANIR